MQDTKKRHNKKKYNTRRKKYRKGMKIRRKLHGGNQKVIVFFLNKQAGFFSQYFFLCTTYIHAKKNNIPFFVNSSEWDYKWKDGWHDYFSSLEEYKDDGTPREIIDYSHHKNTNIAGITNAEYIQAIKDTYVLNDDIRAKIKEQVDKYGKYDSLYIRRGDKAIEMAMDSLETILGYTDLKGTTKKLFIQTDDSRVVEESKKMLPEVEVFTLTPEGKHGAGLGQLGALSPEQRKEETYNLLISIGVFLAGEKCWTDVRSNLGRFHKLAEPERVHTYPADTNLDVNKEVRPFYQI
jgi:hypothetical protein